MGNSTECLSEGGMLENPSMIALKKRFMYDDVTLQELYMIFSEADTSLKGYLTVDDIAKQLFLNSNSLAIPALYRLYELISNNPQRLCFEEWVDGLSVFCLYNKLSLVRFVFDMLDTDGDSIILKQDLMKYASFRNPRTDESIFPDNFADAVSQLTLDKEFKITFEEFTKIAEQLLFLCWPAIKLQEDLKECLFGAKFWERLYVKLEKRELELKNNGKKEIADDSRKRTEAPSKQRMISPELQSLFRQRKLDQNLFKPFLCERKAATVSSDTNLCINITSNKQHRPTEPLQRSGSTLYIKPQI